MKGGEKQMNAISLKHLGNMYSGQVELNSKSRNDQPCFLQLLQKAMKDKNEGFTSLMKDSDKELNNIHMAILNDIRTLADPNITISKKLLVEPFFTELMEQLPIEVQSHIEEVALSQVPLSRIVDKDTDYLQKPAELIVVVASLADRPLTSDTKHSLPLLQKRFEQLFPTVYQGKGIEDFEYRHPLQGNVQKIANFSKHEKIKEDNVYKQIIQQLTDFIGTMDLYEKEKLGNYFLNQNVSSVSKEPNINFSEKELFTIQNLEQLLTQHADLADLAALDNLTNEVEQETSNFTKEKLADLTNNSPTFSTHSYNEIGDLNLEPTHYTIELDETEDVEQLHLGFLKQLQMILKEFSFDLANEQEQLAISINPNLGMLLIDIKQKNGQTAANITVNTTENLTEMFQNVVKESLHSQNIAVAKFELNFETNQNVFTKEIASNGFVFSTNSSYREPVNTQDLSKFFPLQEVATPTQDTILLENQSLPINKVRYFLNQVGEFLNEQQKELQLSNQVHNNNEKSSVIQFPNGANRITIKLLPEQLGQLDVNLIQLDDSIVSKLTTTTQAANKTIDSQLHQIRQVFQGQNIQFELESKKLDAEYKGKVLSKVIDNERIIQSLPISQVQQLLKLMVENVNEQQKGEQTLIQSQNNLGKGLLNKFSDLSNPLTMQLLPEQLGKLDVNLIKQNETTVVQLMTTIPDVKKIIESQLHLLRQMFDDQNLKFEINSEKLAAEFKGKSPIKEAVNERFVEKSTTSRREPLITHDISKIFASQQVTSATQGIGVPLNQNLPLSQLHQFVMHVGENLNEQQKGEQLLRQFQNVIGRSSLIQFPNGSNQLTIKLFPQHLGRLDVKLIQQEGIIVAKLITTTQAAKKTIESQLHQLRQAFIGQNLQVEKIEITTQQQQLFNTEKEQQEGKHNDQQHKRKQTETREEERNEEESFKDFFEETINIKA